MRYALAAHACFLVAIYAQLPGYWRAVAGTAPPGGRAATEAGPGASPGAAVGR